ncbi:MAG: VOC family protein [Methanobacteriota archaeon]|nr:MAG: VOC family protein [Euryarchaeota archaeon]
MAMAMVQDFGHLTFEVGDMDKAIRFYRDVLGFTVAGKVDPVWTVVATKGGTLTLYRKKDPIPCSLPKGGSPLNLHVSDFTKAAVASRRRGTPRIAPRARRASLGGVTGTRSVERVPPSGRSPRTPHRSRRAASLPAPGTCR